MIKFRQVSLDGLVRFADDLRDNVLVTLVIAIPLAYKSTRATIEWGVDEVAQSGVGSPASSIKLRRRIDRTPCSTSDRLRGL